MRSWFSEKIRKISVDNIIVIKNIVGAFFIRGMGLILSLFSMPAYIRFFNNDIVLGLWFTLLSVLNWILNFDLGIGNGLRNHLTRVIADKNKEEMKRYISSAYISIGIICLGAIFAFCAGFNLVDWNSVFNVENEVISEKTLLLTIKIVFIGIVAQLFFRLISSILYAVQKSAINNSLSLITSIIIVISLYALPSTENNINMVTMAYVHLCAVLLPLFVTTVIVFSTKEMRGCIPSLKFVDYRHIKDVLSLGGKFFYIQIVYMVIIGTNEYLITAFAGNEYVVEYQVYHRIYTLGSTLFLLVMTPIWSIVTKALAEGNKNWIGQLYKRVLSLVVVGIIAEMLIIPMAQIIVNVWLNETAIVVLFPYSVSFALLGALMIFSSAMSTFANGIGELKTQVVCFSVGAIVKIPLAYILIKVLDSWIGVVWANVFAMTVYCIIQPIFLKKKMFNK